MEEIVNSTPVMLVYPKATSKTQGILAVFQHENKVNHGYTSNSAHILWFAGIDLNGVLQWSQLLSGRTSVSSLAHPPGQSLREYFAEHKAFERHLAGMLALWWYQFSRFLPRPNGNFFNMLAKNSHESHQFFPNSGSLLTFGVFRFVFWHPPSDVASPLAPAAGWAPCLRLLAAPYIPSIPTKGPASNFPPLKIGLYKYQLYNRGVFLGKSSQTLLCWF